MKVHGPWGLRKAIALVLLLLAGPRAQGGGGFQIIPVPVPVPNGDSGFVGTVNVSFQAVSNGNIVYTLDGTMPSNNNGIDYKQNSKIPISNTCTLKAVHIRSGLASAVISADFIRAKAPAPKLRLSPAANLYPAGSLNFFPSVTCSLLVDSPLAGTGIQILYTLNGSSPGDAGTVYSGPFVQKASAPLQAIARLAGYDDSDPLQANLTLAAQLTAPVATPAGKNFATKNLGIKLATSPNTAVIRFSVDPNARLDTCPIASADSIIITGKNIGDSVVLRAQAFSSNAAPSPEMRQTYFYYPQVQMPTSSLPQGPFNDQTSLTLSSATPQAVVHYTLDGSTPTLASPAATGAIPLTDSVTIKAIAFRPPQPQSVMNSFTYSLRLTQPSADQNSRQYVDSLTVHLSAPCTACQIIYTLDGTSPTLQSPPSANPSTIPITNAGTTVLTAVAVKGHVMSAPARYSYTKTDVVVKLSTPAITPPGRDFHDTLWVSITTGDANAEIDYTTNGEIPTRKSPLAPDKLRLDSSQTLSAIAFPTTGKVDSSAMQQETYTLSPAKPSADPPGQSYKDAVSITLSTSTKGGSIYWMVGDQFVLGSATKFDAAQIIKLDSSAHLSAVTITGAGATLRVSDTLHAVYEIYHDVATDTLAGGTARVLSGNFAFTNTSSTPIIAKLHVTAGQGITGFKNADEAILIQAAQPGATVKVVYTKPPDQAAALYKIVTGGVQFVSAGTRADITAAGDYFVGIDTLPPALTLVSQTAKAGDSTTLLFTVTDNVLSPACYVESPGIPAGKSALRAQAGGKYAAAIKNPGTDPQPLWFRATASDNINLARLPADSNARIFAPQAWGSLAVPHVLTLGKSDYPWDMAGLPLSAKSPVTWGQIRNDNPGADLHATVLKDSVNYVDLADDSLIRPGMAFWLGSTKPLANLSLSRFVSGESQSDGTYRVALRKGWNMVTNPSLAKMYWPSSRRDANFTELLVKGLYTFDFAKMDYVQTDSLDPWKGYFVYTYGGDTSLALLSAPRSAPAPKASASAQGLDLILDYGRAIPLRLSAGATADDGLAREDEPMLPALRPRLQAWSQRGSRRLATDMIKFAPGQIMRWQIMLSDPGSPAGSKSLPSIRVDAAALPAGYEAWAIAPARGLKFKLSDGVALPVSGLAQDTLTVLAGPLAKLSALPEWSRASLSATDFGFALRIESGAAALRIDLPTASAVQARVWSLDGRLLAQAERGTLAAGHYSLPMGKLPAGRMGIVEVTVSSDGATRRYARKAVW